MLSRNMFDTIAQACAVVLDWSHRFYNHVRPSTIGMASPINYENAAATDREAAQRKPLRFGGDRRAVLRTVVGRCRHGSHAGNCGGSAAGSRRA